MARRVSPSDDLEIYPQGARQVLAEYTGYVLQLAARLRESELDEALAPLDLTISKLRIISIVRRLKSCTMGELALLSSVDRTTLTRTVDHLTADGLMERTASARDRRKVSLSLTAKGHALHRKAIPLVTETNERHFATLTDEQLRQSVLALREIVGAVVTEPRDLELLLNFARSSPAKQIVDPED
jgi:DNA-binding MarR family transcriptional regulator